MARRAAAMDASRVPSELVPERLRQGRVGGMRLSLPTLSPARLGLALTALTAAAWLTGLPYLLLRLGVAIPVPLARLDGPHVYVGAAMAMLLAAKVAGVGLRTRLGRQPGVLIWQRWLSFGVLALYGAVLVSGVALLIPWPAPVRSRLVNLHLLTAVWALVATALHVLVYLRRRLPAGILAFRVPLAIAGVILPVLAFAALPIMLAPLTQLGGGAAWRPVGPPRMPFLHLFRLNDGRMVGVGQGVWISTDGATSWHAVPDLSTQFLLAAAAAPGGARFYAGGPDGLFTAPDASGPYVRLPAPSEPVDSVFVDPALPGTIWLGGHGLWRSTDQGTTWSAVEQGLVPRGSIWAFDRYEGGLYVGGSTGVYRLQDDAWTRSLDLPEVVSLDADRTGLWASSMGGGLAVLGGGRWRTSNAGLQAHHGGAVIHVTSFASNAGGRAFAGTMEQGVWESLDSGASWYSLSPGFAPGAIWRIVPVGGGVVAATDTGLYRYVPENAPVPGPLWWLGLVGTAVVVTVASGAGLASPAHGRPSPGARGSSGAPFERDPVLILGRPTGPPPVSASRGRFGS